MKLNHRPRPPPGLLRPGSRQSGRRQPRPPRRNRGSRMPASPFQPGIAAAFITASVFARCANPSANLIAGTRRDAIPATFPFQWRGSSGALRNPQLRVSNPSLTLLSERKPPDTETLPARLRQWRFAPPCVTMPVARPGRCEARYDNYQIPRTPARRVYPPLG